MAVAIEFADVHGTEALTLRALGDALGVHHTALYRHFRNKNELIDAMFDHIVVEATKISASTNLTGRAKVESIALAFRQVLHEHPVMMMTIVMARGSSTSVAVEREVIQALRELGCAEDRIAVHYQLIESFVFGTVAFDFAGAPNHISMRRERHLSSGEIPMIQVAKSDEQIDQLNEFAFKLGLKLILDSAQGLIK